MRTRPISRILSGPPVTESEAIIYLEPQLLAASSGTLRRLLERSTALHGDKDLAVSPPRSPGEFVFVCLGRAKTSFAFAKIRHCSHQAPRGVRVLPATRLPESYDSDPCSDFPPHKQKFMERLPSLVRLILYHKAGNTHCG